MDQNELKPADQKPKHGADYQGTSDITPLESVQYSVWTRVWIILCIVFNFATGIFTYVNDGSMISILPIVVAAMYFLLLTNKKWKFFYIICALVFVMIMSSYMNGGGLLSFRSVLNPIITFLLINMDIRNSSAGK